MPGGVVSTLEILCGRVTVLEGLVPRVLSADGAPDAFDPPSAIDERAEDTAPVIYLDTLTDNLYIWSPTSEAWIALPSSIINLPFQLIGEAEPGTLADSILGTDAVYHRGDLLVGGIDKGATRSAGPPRLEVIGKFATGGGNHSVTGLECAAVGGKSNTVTGENAIIDGGNGNTSSGFNAAICGGANNESSNTHSFIGGGASNVASGPQSAIIGGSGNLASDYDSIIAGGMACDNSGQRALVTGSENINSGDFSIVAGSLNVNSGDASLIAGSNNTIYANTSIIAGTGNTVQVAGLSSIMAGFECPSLAASRSIVAGDTITCAGYGNIISGEAHNALGSKCIVGGTLNTVPSGAASLLVSGTSLVVGGAISNGWVGGNGAQLSHGSSFIFSAHAGVATVAANSFTFAGAGGARFFSNSGATTGVSLASGASAWAAVSLRDLKANIVEVEGAAAKVARLGLYEYSYKDQDGNAMEHRQLGPMADGEDGWHEVVGVGAADTVSSHDMAALALAAIKDLKSQLDAALDRISQLEIV